MADPSDYATDWAGTYSPPIDIQGVHILDDEISVGADGDFSGVDTCTRVLYEDAHPRTHPGGQRYPGPYGAGRASDRVGPTPSERRRALHRAEGFSGGRGGDPYGADYSADYGADYSAEFGSDYGEVDVSPEDRDEYIQGSRRLGAPGFRGMVTSSRRDRAAIDEAVWDNRPPRYNPHSSNADAHLFIPPGARGPARYAKDSTFPGVRQVDSFATGGAEGQKGEAHGAPRLYAVDLQTIILVVVLIFFAVFMSTHYAVMVTEQRFAGRAQAVPAAAT